MAAIAVGEREGWAATQRVTMRGMRRVSSIFIVIVW